MHARTIALGLVAGAALALAPAGLAKGPVKATMSGPGLDGALVWTSSSGDPGDGTSFGQLVQEAGFFPATFGQAPDPMLDTRPAGDLGPRYSISYVVPSPDGGDSRIEQAVYPYADPAPVTYTRPGQPFFTNEHTRGGWFVAPAALEQTLVQAGLPADPPGRGGSDSGSPLDGPWPIAGGVLLALLVGCGFAVAFRRRAPEPAT